MRAKPLRVLVIDNAGSESNVVAELLRENGYVTAIAFDTAGAIEIAESMDLHAVILDLRLPGGLQLARQLRSVPALTDSTMIATKGSIPLEDRLAARAAGIAHYCATARSIPHVLAAL